jgi:Zn finger protein HypA/HybF involved in hydrogenase expression
MKMTPARKRRHQFNLRWMTFWAVCGKCGHKWQAVMPNVGQANVDLECPKCHEQAGAVDETRAVTVDERRRAMDYATEMEALKKRRELQRN